MKQLLALLAVLILLTGCTASVQPAAQTQPTLPAADPTTEVTTEAATEPAETAMDTITTQPPQEYVEVFREGESSLIPVQIVQGTVGSYTMAMDPEYFTFQPQEAVDLFAYAEWEGVYYAVSAYQADAAAQEFIDSAMGQFSRDYADSYTESITIGGYPATAVYFSNCKDAPAYQKHLFLVDCDGTCYLIEASFVFEMSEGLYRIMRACFDTLTPVS